MSNWAAEAVKQLESMREGIKARLSEWVDNPSLVDAAADEIVAGIVEAPQPASVEDVLELVEQAMADWYAAQGQLKPMIKPTQPGGNA